MATSFPTSLDTAGGTLRTDISSTTDMDASGFEHDELHVNVHGAALALEAKVGTGASTPVADAVFMGTGTGTSGWDTSPTFKGTVTLGVNDTGVDLVCYGATDGAYMKWNQATDDLQLVGAAGLDIAGDIDVDGTANFDIVDIDGAVDMASTLEVTGSAGFGTGTMTEKANVIGNLFVQGPDGWNGAGDLALVRMGSGATNESFGYGYKYGTGMILSVFKSGGGGSFGSSTFDAMTIADTTAQISVGGNSAGGDLINYTLWSPNLQVQAPVHIKNWTGTAGSPVEYNDWPSALLNLSTASNYSWNSMIQFGMSNDQPYNTNLDLYWHISLYDSDGSPPDVTSTSDSTIDLAIMGPGEFSIRTGSADRFRITAAGAVSIGGSLSKGSGSFDIAHPTKGGDWRLRHSFIEGPQADLIYRGIATLSSGTATVDLDAVSGMTDGTWEALNRNSWAMVASSGNAVEWSLSGKTLTITSDTADAVCSWMVIGERQDDHMKSAEGAICDDDGYLIVEYEGEPATEDYPEWEAAE